MSLMKVHVNIPLDFTLGGWMHYYLSPPKVPAPAPMKSVEVPMLMGNLPGYFCGQQKWSNKAKAVHHKGLPIALDGSDQGTMSFDVTIPPDNLFYAVIWPLSSRKIVFGASTVKMNGTAAGCTDISRGLPVLACGDPISMPLTISIITPTNTVYVGVTFLDLLAGALLIAASIIFDYLLNKYKGKIPGNWKLGERFAKYFFSNKSTQAIVAKLLAKTIPGMDPGDTAKRIASTLASFGVSFLKGKPSFKLVILGGTKGGPVGAEVEWTPTYGWVLKGHALGWQGATGGPANDWGTPM